MIPFTEVENIYRGTDVKWRKIKGSVWNMLGVRWLLDFQEEIQNRLMTLEVGEMVQTGLQHFKNHTHTVFKAIGLDEFTLGVSVGNEEESSKLWTPECSKSWRSGRRDSHWGRRKTRRGWCPSEGMYHRGWHKHLCERLPWDQVRREEETGHRVVAGIMS